MVRIKKKVTLDPGQSQEVVISVLAGSAGLYTVQVDGLSGAFTVEGQADIRVDAIVINPTSIVPNGAVNIQLQCTNYGGSDGERTIPIYINGVHERDGIMTLAAGKSGAVNVAYTAFVEGTYEVTADNASASFVCSVPQPYSGTLTGIAKRTTGVGIAGAIVEATNDEGSWLGITDSSGHYNISLPAGTYQAKAKAAKFYDSSPQQFTVAGGETATVNFILQIMSVNKIKYLLAQVAQTLTEGGYIYPNWQQLNFSLGDLVTLTLRFNMVTAYVKFGPMTVTRPDGQSFACRGGGFYHADNEPGLYYSQWQTGDTGNNPTFLTVPGTYLVSFQLFSSEDNVNWAQTDSFNIVLGIVS